MLTETPSPQTPRLTYHQLFDEVPCYISVQDRDLVLLQTNRRFKEEFGDHVGRPCYEVYKHRTAPCEVCPVAETFADGQVHSSQEIVRSRTGEPVHVLVYTTPIRNENGEIEAVMEMSTDITQVKRLQSELLESRELYRLLFEEAPCYISVQDRNLHIVAANRRFKETFGDRPGGFCYEVYKHRNERCDPCPVAETLADGQMHRSEETVRSQSGEPLDMIVYTAPIRNENGEIEAVMEMSTDITQVRQMQHQLTSLGQLVASIAHSIKGIVMALDGGMYVVNSGFARKDDAVVQKGWDMVQRNVERVSKMVLNILFCAKDRIPEFAPVHPGDLVREVCELYEPKVQRKGTTLRAEISAEVGEMEADAQGLHAMLIGLIENALDACLLDEDQETHQISLAVQNGESEVVFEVTDDGIGMDPETQAQLFSPSFSTKGSGGTGLGLLVAEKVVREHHGAITVSSTPGQGTTFTIRLPQTATVSLRGPHSEGNDSPAY